MNEDDDDEHNTDAIAKTTSIVVPEEAPFPFISTRREGS
jgi:hypothetical protein